VYVVYELVYESRQILWRQMAESSYFAIHAEDLTSLSAPRRVHSLRIRTGDPVQTHQVLQPTIDSLTTLPSGYQRRL
jgi:hypothetical protein